MVLTKVDIDEAITSMSTKLTSSFQTMLDDSINEIKNSIIENLRLSNQNLQDRVNSLEREVKELKEAHVTLERSSEAAFQHGRLEQVVISGIPAEVEHKDLEEKSLRILNEIKNVQIQSRDIAACHRLGKKNDTIIRFINRKDADDCFENRMKLKNINREEHGLAPGANIYIRENLSPYISKLAYYCRELKRREYIEKVTTFKGVIKIFRTVENSRMVKSVIGHKDDLLKFFPNLNEILTNM